MLPGAGVRVNSQQHDDSRTTSPAVFSPVSTVQAYDVGEHRPIKSVAYLVVMWYACSVVGNITSKMILARFAHPCTVMMGPIMVGASSVPLITRFLSPKNAAFILTGDATDTTHTYKWSFAALLQTASQRKRLCLVLGVLSLCSGLFHRVALLSVHVSFAHTIKAISPLYSCALSYLFFHTLPSRMSMFALVFVVAGIMLSAYEESKHTGSGYGILMLQLSVGTGALGTVIQKYVFSAFDKAEVFCLTTSAATVLNLCLWVFTDLPVLASSVYEGKEVVKGSVWSLVLLVIANSFTLALQHFTSLSALHKLSPTTHSLVGCMKRVIVIAAAAIFFRNAMTSRNAIGAIVAIIGVTAYERGKQKKAPPSVADGDKPPTASETRAKPPMFIARMMATIMPKKQEMLLV
eukprot:Rhum_TRINITY_DN18935_c0_g1::Rhum_TRINITY_DN18935_c0_g1_i1::g.168857::m.168857/K15283/SLC35E1; solute carrier family 35, member E1